jgi:hypothetical protein
VKWFGDKGTPNEENKFLDERLDPYLGSDPVEVQAQMQKPQAQMKKVQKAGQSRRSKKRPTMTRTRRQRRNNEKENNT